MAMLNVNTTKTRICAAEMAVYDMRPSARAEKYMCVIVIR